MIADTVYFETTKCLTEGVFIRKNEEKSTQIVKNSNSSIKTEKLF